MQSVSSQRYIALLVALTLGGSQGLPESGKNGTISSRANLTDQSDFLRMFGTRQKPLSRGKITTGTSEEIARLSSTNPESSPILEASPSILMASVPIGLRRLDDNTLASASTGQARGNKFIMPQGIPDYNRFDESFNGPTGNSEMAGNNRGRADRRLQFDRTSDEIMHLMNQNANLRSYIKGNMASNMQENRRSGRDDQQIYDQLQEQPQQRTRSKKQSRRQQVGQNDRPSSRGAGNAHQIHQESRKTARQPIIGGNRSGSKASDPFGNSLDGDDDDEEGSKLQPRNDDGSNSDDGEEDDDESGVSPSPAKQTKRRLNKAASNKNRQNYQGGKPKAQSYLKNDNESGDNNDGDGEEQSSADEDGDSTNLIDRGALVGTKRSSQKSSKSKGSQELDQQQPFGEMSIINDFVDDENPAAASTASSESKAVAGTGSGQQDLQVAAGHHHGHSHGHYYQYVEVPKKKAWKFGFKRGNHKHEIMRHEKGHKSHFHSHFKWHAKEKCKKKKKCKSVGEMKWEYKHDKKHHHG